MSKSYMPNKDAEFTNWLTNFIEYGSANAVALGLTQAQVDAAGEQMATFDTAYAAHLVEVQTAKVKREAKDAARKAVVASVRSLVKRIQANPAVTDAQRLALGITVPKPKAPVPVPASRPVAEVERIEAFTHSFRVFDSETNRSARPAGVDAAEVWMKIAGADQAPPDTGELAFAGVVTTSRFQRQYAEAERGKTAYYRLRWVNTRGQSGEFGPLASATIAA